MKREGNLLLETRAGMEILSVSVRVFLKAVGSMIKESNGQLWRCGQCCLFV